MRDERDYNRELISMENREFALAIIERLLAFNAKWRKNWESEKSQKSKNPLLWAYKKASNLLPAISAKMVHVPAANRDGTGNKGGRWLLVLNNGLNWQNLYLNLSNEAIFATLNLKLEAIRNAIEEYPDITVKEGPYVLHGMEAKEIRDYARGVLIHALQMRYAIDSVQHGEARVPVIFSPLAEKTISTVLEHKTREDWERTKGGDDFWIASKEEYQESNDLNKSLCDVSLTTGISQSELINRMIDNYIYVNVNDTKICIKMKEFCIFAEMPIWFSIDGKKAHYYQNQINLDELNVPDSILHSMEGELDSYIEHWITRGLGTRIKGVRKESFSQIRLEIEEGPGKVIHLPYLPEIELRASPPEKLRNPIKSSSKRLPKQDKNVL